jgi:hypothetical protein
MAMDDAEADKLWQRYQECEQIILAIYEGKVVDGSPAELEGRMLEEQDEIEFKLGEKYFEDRDRQQ